MHNALGLLAGALLLWGSARTGGAEFSGGDVTLRLDDEARLTSLSISDRELAVSPIPFISLRGADTAAGFVGPDSVDEKRGAYRFADLSVEVQCVPTQSEQALSFELIVEGIPVTLGVCSCVWHFPSMRQDGTGIRTCKARSR